MNQVPVRVMSSTARQAFGDKSSAGEGKLAAALLISTPGGPSSDSVASNTAAIRSGSRMSAVAVRTRPPVSSASSPAAALSRSAFRPTIIRSAPRRANSAATALPRPEPPPVTSTTLPSYVPAGSALEPSGGGAASPGVLMLSFMEA